MPTIVVLAGPNGAGKSTAAPRVLRGALRVTEFVNADVIAQGLSGFAPEGVALEAGAIMLRRMHDLAARRVSFAFETTLAARSLAPWLKSLRTNGYRTAVLFFWLPTADLAVARVQQRALSGGHDVPEATIRRRWALGIQNFRRMYQPLADSWRVYDGSRTPRPIKIAERPSIGPVRIYNARAWDEFTTQEVT